MDHQAARKLHQILAPLAQSAWHRATFVIDEQGATRFHMGTSAALRFDGGPVGDGALADDAKDSLYLTSLGGGLLLGVLFDDRADIERVREFVTPRLETLSAIANGTDGAPTP